MNVRAILEHKGRDVVTLPPETTVAEACYLLHRRRIGAAPVAGPDGAIAGIFSERDVVAGLAAHGPGVAGLTVADLMSREVRHCAPEDEIGEIMAVMTERRVRHLPVLEDGRLGGIVSIGDVVKARLDEAAHEVDSLRQYVLAGR
ncbi:MAG: CBS domain-containing protein [Dongiaceae bacterium]